MSVGTNKIQRVAIGGGVANFGGIDDINSSSDLRFSDDRKVRDERKLKCFMGCVVALFLLLVVIAILNFSFTVASWKLLEDHVPEFEPESVSTPSDSG